MSPLRLFIASLFAYSGILAGRIASPNTEWVEWRQAADDAIEAAREFSSAWDENQRQ